MPLTVPLPATKTENLQGAGFIALSMLGFAVNDALMKLVGPGIGLFQSVLLRSLFAMAMVVVIAYAFGALHRLPPRRDVGWMAARAVGEIGAVVCILTALFRMPLAAVSAILQTLPLSLTLVGALFLGERVGWRRWLAILVGFVGVLVLVRPGAADFDPNAVWALAAVGFVTLRDAATRQLGRGVHSLFVTVVTTTVIVILGALGVAVQGVWVPVDGPTLLGLAGAAAAILVGYVFGVQGMRIGDIGFIAPFRYTILIWSMLLGFLLFAERPDAATWLGAAIIVAAGLYTFWRERRVAGG